MAAQRDDPRSTLALARRLLGLRASRPVLTEGDQEMLDLAEDVLAWSRSTEGDRVVAAVNMGREPRTLALGPAGAPARLLISTDPDRPRGDEPADAVPLAPDEAVILRV